MVDDHVLVQQDMKTGLFCLQTKINVFQIHKVSLVKQSDLTEYVSLDQNAGKGDKFGFFHRFVFGQLAKVHMGCLAGFPVNFSPKTKEGDPFLLVPNRRGHYSGLFVLGKVSKQGPEKCFFDHHVRIDDQNILTSRLQDFPYGLIITGGETKICW